MAPVEAKTERTLCKVTDISQPVPLSATVRNVLFATDFSATSETALPYATAICRRYGSTLHSAHVVSEAGMLLMTGGVDYVSMGTLYEDAHTEAREKLADLSQYCEGIPHRNYVRHGSVWKNLAILVEENNIDLIVVGTHGRTGLGRLLLGSVAEDILRHAPCPVLTVGPRVSGRAKLPTFRNRGRDLAPPELDLRHILFATNFGPNMLRLAQQAVTLAEQFRSRLTLMHVIDDYTDLGRRPGPIEAGIQRLRDLVPIDAALSYAPENVIEFGAPTECILRIAEEREADMIILGARRSAEVGSTHLPFSSAHCVIAHAHCPVLTIRE
jgi:nucleotide-binding universal stress UspA family protein